MEIGAHGWPAIYGLLAAASDDTLVVGAMTGVPDTWEGIFAMEQRDPEKFSEPLIVPELRGEMDIPDLLATIRKGEHNYDRL